MGKASKYPDLGFFLILIFVAFLFYRPFLDNFFVWDDFIWLNRARTFLSNPAQIFRVDVMYFDPVVHLSFWLNYLVTGLDPYWYHVADLLLHGTNGILVHMLVKKISGDGAAAKVCSLAFVCSFAAIDAVGWSSSRVDLFATLFSLLTLVFLVKHIDEGRKIFLAVALACYVPALASKGTPVVIPAIAVCLLLLKKAPKGSYASVVPFAAIAAAFPILISIAPGEVKVAKGISLHNLGIAFSGFFIPERFILVEKLVMYAGACLLITAVCIAWKLPEEMNRLKLFGILFAVIGLLPVLGLQDFKIAGPNRLDVNLLNSASHRVYLASVGMSVFVGAMVRGVYLRYQNNRFAVVGLSVACLLCLALSFQEIRIREDVWAFASRTVKKQLHGILPYKGKIPDDSVVALVNFGMSRGFINPMLQVYLGLNEIVVYKMRGVPEEIPDDPTLLRHMNRSFMFVNGGDRVYDASNELKALLLTSLMYHSANGEMKPVYYNRYRSQAALVNQQISMVQPYQ